MRRLLRHVSGVSLANAINGILGLLFVPVAVRRLGAAGYGQFAIFSVLTSYAVLLELGLGKNLVRCLASTHDTSEQVAQLRLANGLYITIGGIFLLFLPLVGFLVPQYLFPVPAEFYTSVQIIAMLAIVDYVLGIPSSIMQTRCVASEGFGRYSRFLIVTGSYRYGLGFLGLLLTTNPAMVVAIMMSRRLIDVGVARWIMGPLPPGAWIPRFSLQEFRRLIQSFAALSIAQILQVLIVSAGAILVNRTFGVRSLGIYRAAFDIASRIWFFSSTLGLVLFPKFVRLISNPHNTPLLAKILPPVVTLSCMIFVVFGLLASIVAQPVFIFLGLTGADYVQFFILIAAAICLNAHANFSYEFTQAAGRYRSAVWCSVISLVFLVGTFYLMRSRGAAIAVGSAWIASQIAYSLATDASLAGILALPKRQIIEETGKRGIAITCLVVGAYAILCDQMLLYGVMLLSALLLGALSLWSFQTAWRAQSLWNTPIIDANLETNAGLTRDAV